MNHNHDNDNTVVRHCVSYLISIGDDVSVGGDAVAPVMGRTVAGLLVVMLVDLVSSSTSDYCHFTAHHTLCGYEVS